MSARHDGHAAAHDGPPSTCHGLRRGIRQARLRTVAGERTVQGGHQRDHRVLRGFRREEGERDTTIQREGYADGGRAGGFRVAQRDATGSQGTQAL